MSAEFAIAVEKLMFRPCRAGERRGPWQMREGWECDYVITGHRPDGLSAEQVHVREEARMAVLDEWLAFWRHTCWPVDFGQVIKCLLTQICRRRYELVPEIQSRLAARFIRRVAEEADIEFAPPGTAHWSAEYEAMRQGNTAIAAVFREAREAKERWGENRRAWAAAVLRAEPRRNWPETGVVPGAGTREPKS